MELGFGPSVLPNLGLSGSVALRVREGTRVSTWIETELTSQFLDDADLADDGNPGAGNWTQLRAGAKFTLPYGERHYATARTGLHWFDARGEPNIIDDPGHYYGTYFGLGFETRVTEHLAMGPELALLPSFATGGGTGHLVPQLAWRILWRL